MIGNIIQLCGSVMLVWMIISKNKFDLSQELKTIVQPTTISRETSIKKRLEHLLNIVGAIFSIFGFLISTANPFSAFEQTIFVNSKVTIGITTIVLALSLLTVRVLALLTEKRFRKFVNSGDSMRPGTASISIGNLTGITNVPSCCLEAELPLMKQDIQSLKDDISDISKCIKK